MPNDNTKLIKIGVFYDGNFFLHVSNYYLYRHERRARISITGLHDFVREEVAQREGTNARYCQIVDAHYFRGRLQAALALERGNMLYNERLFDDVLIREGVVTHYLPLSQVNNKEAEKGIDVWFALEAFELAMYKHFDVMVLVAGDTDYVPLARKLNTLGTRVMVLGWDFKYIDENNEQCETRTSQALLNEVSYPVMMSNMIDDRTRKSDESIKNLFLPRREQPVTTVQRTGPSDMYYGGKIQNILAGFGWITPDLGGENVFFHYSGLTNRDFNDLQKGDYVEYEMGKNEKGVCAINIRVLGD